MKKTRHYKLFTGFISILIMLAGIAACDNGNNNEPPPKAKVEKKPAVVHLPSLSHYATKEVVGYEDLDNAEQWSEPRIQFVSDYPRERYSAIWTMKLDGSDIKLAYTMKDINEKLGGEYGIGGVITHTPKRSPDNRYIILTSLDNEAILVDLRTKKFEIIDQGSGKPEYNWAADSENIIFYKNQQLKNYNLKIKKLTLLPEKIYSRDLYLLKDQKTFLSVMSDEVVYYNKENGEILKKIKLPVDNLKSSSLSSNENYLYYNDSYVQGIFNLKIRKPVVHIDFNRMKNNDRLSKGVFTEDNKLYIYIRGTSMYKFSMASKIFEKFQRLEFWPNQMTLINTEKSKK